MNNRSFDELTDWIGIPLTIVLLLFLVVVDVRSVHNRLASRLLMWSGGVVLVGVMVIVVARFIRLA